MEAPKRLHSVEVMRGLAALAVAWFHLTNGYPHNAVRASGNYGWLGVDCFFVISGFVIPYSLHSSAYRLADFRRFVLRRMVRLEPPFVASILLVVALNMISTLAPGFAGAPQHYSILQILSHLFYVIPLTKFHWIQPVYWSLAYEFVFYLVTGLMFVIFWKRNIVLVMLAAVVCMALKFAVAGAWDGRILLFVMGISTARYLVRRDSVAVFLGCLTICFIGMVAAGSVLSGGVGLGTAIAIAFARVPAWPPLTFLGTISYSLYLMHVPFGGRIVNLGKRLGDGPAFDLALSLVALAGSLLVAWLFYRLVESPATRLSRRITMVSRNADTQTLGSVPVHETV